jgi:hypothetical protein
MSLKAALERLLGAPCYHMLEVFAHPASVPAWHAAVRGEGSAWDQIFDGYAAAVDYPASAFWKEITDAHPEAIILHSVRDAEGWWRSADATILNAFRGPEPDDPNRRAWLEMCRDLFSSRLTADYLDEDAMKAAHDRHDAEVAASAPSDRLLRWWPADGWGPLCEALGVPIPDEPFPRLNTTEDWRARAEAAD